MSTISFIVILYLARQTECDGSSDYDTSLSPGPLHLENEVVVAVAVEGCDGFLRILLVVVVDESKPLQRDKCM